MELTVVGLLLWQVIGCFCLAPRASAFLPTTTTSSSSSSSSSRKTLSRSIRECQLYTTSIPSDVSVIGQENTQPKNNIGFEAWVSDAPEETRVPKRLDVKGTIPSYVRGSLVRNGGGIWSLDGATGQENSNAGKKGSYKSAHIFDGLAKVTRYDISSAHPDDENVVVEFSSRFVDSSLYERHTSGDPAHPSVHVGPLFNQETQQMEPQTNWISALLRIASFDNAPVNVWDYQASTRRNGNSIACLTDTPIRATVNTSNLETLERARPPQWPHRVPFGSFYEITNTAHPEYCKKGTGATYNIGTLLGIPSFQLCVFRDNLDGSREVVASYPLPTTEIPYLHSFGLTPQYAVVVLQPLRQDSNIVNVLQNGFLPTMKHVNSTQVLIFDLEKGVVVADPILSEPVYFYHTMSTTETERGVSIKVCGYQVPDLITGPDQFFRFDRAGTPEGRNRIHPGGSLCDIDVSWDKVDEKSSGDATARVTWTPVQDTATKTNQGFELPTTRYSRTFNGQGPWQYQRHARYAYAFGAYTRGSPDYDSWGLLKIDTVAGQAVTFRETDSCFYSEPIFVANPDAQEEDAGVLLCTRFDGTTETTSLIVIDAQKMELLVEANTGTRVAMDFHGCFLPS